MKSIVHLAALATLPLVAGPSLTLANPCRKVAVAVKTRVIVKKQIVAVATPVYVPSYLATIIPQASYTYNISTPPSAPAQTIQYQLPAPVQYAPPAPTYAAPAACPMPAPTYSAPRCGGTAGAMPSRTNAYANGGGGSLEDALRRFDARLGAIEGALRGQQPGQDAGAAAPGDEGGALLQNRCAACHDSSTSQRTGRGLTLTQGGQLLQQSPAVWDKVLTEVLAERMPKGGPAFDQPQKQALGAFVNEQKRVLASGQ